MEKTIGNTLKEQLRPLTRGEVKDLRKRGIILTKIDPATADEAVDEVLAMVFGEDNPEIDVLANRDALDLFGEIIDLSYGRPKEAEVKNSSPSGAGTTAADGDGGRSS